MQKPIRLGEKYGGEYLDVCDEMILADKEEASLRNAEPLAVTEVDGTVWELMNLELTETGQLTGWLRIGTRPGEDNTETETNLRSEERFSLFINGLYPMGGYCRLKAYDEEPIQMIPFAVLNTEGIRQSYTDDKFFFSKLTQEEYPNMLKFMGVNRIEEVIFQGNTEFVFRLSEPWDIPGTDIPQVFPSISEGIYIGGIHIGKAEGKLDIENNPKRANVSFLVINKTGEPQIFDFERIISENEQRYLMGSQRTSISPGIFPITISPFKEGEQIKEIEMQLVKPGSRKKTMVIRLNDPVVISKEETLLTYEEFTIDEKRTHFEQQ